MIRSIEDRGRPADPKQMDDLERELGVELPASYRVFLAANNGGRPVPNVYRIWNHPTQPHGAVAWFLGIGRLPESTNILWHIQNKQWLPANLVPIADDGCGDLVCLRLLEPSAGAVVFWDYHGAWGQYDDPGDSIVFPIADTFEEFLEELHDDPDDSL